MRDFLGDMLTRIKNGHNAKVASVILHPYSPKMCIYILEKLQHEGYIRGFQQWSSNNVKKIQIKVLLKYNGEGAPAIRGIFRVSKPGCRVYLSTKALWKPKSGRGIFFLSTPQGIFTDKDARILNVGGEILFGIY